MIISNLAPTAFGFTNANNAFLFRIGTNTHVGYIVGYNINDYVLIGFKDDYGWDKKDLTENDVFVSGISKDEYETYWYLQVGEIILK